MEILEEHILVKKYLEKFELDYQPIMIQIGANEGMYEYAKPDGKDFVFEFLLNNPYWEAVLIEPLPSIFIKLKLNYENHKNKLSFLNCAIAEKIETKLLTVVGKEGKSSSLLPIKGPKRTKVIGEELVQCVPYSFVCNILGIDTVDFVKIDAEGYDEIIVKSIVSSTKYELLPKIIFWESLGKNNKQKEAFEDYVGSKGYSIFITGLNKKNVYMDRVAIKKDFYPIKDL